MTITTYRADDVRPLLLSGHVIRRPPRRENVHQYAPDAHVRDADGNLVGRVHESALRKLVRDDVVRVARRGEVYEWVLR